jgi:histidinol-phosphate aminotransferase
MSALLKAAKPWVAALSTYQPGRPIEEVARELGLGDPESILKLASNENALGPSPRALAAMRNLAGRMHIYPDGDTFYLRQALARRLQVPESHLFFGHGSNEILALLGHVYLEKGTSIVASAQAFVVYKLVAALYEAETIEVPMRNFTHDLEAMRAAIRPDTRLVFVANPNNPTGPGFPTRTWCVSDQSAAPCGGGGGRGVHRAAARRAGSPRCCPWFWRGGAFLFCAPSPRPMGWPVCASAMRWLRPRASACCTRCGSLFNVNAMAQAAALAALADDDHVERTRRMVAEGLAQLTAGLRQRGLVYVPSEVNFILVKVGRGREISHALQRSA